MRGEGGKGGASITAAPAHRMSYYLDPVSSCQTLQPPDCLGVMRSSGGMAVTVVPHMQPPVVCHPQNPAPPRPLYGQHITLQEVPNGPEYSPNGMTPDALCVCVGIGIWEI
ncbi:SAGA complex subunit spt20 [Labeo rohita]|uniref:SAGA complex subunit spt20 n=1 Tax=Labeo rohita TaxID=84645 RepID=A0ABQ8LW13_LABRO|nr:SAGA complex subunit spt20 [Labeo rohita]